MATEWFEGMSFTVCDECHRRFSACICKAIPMTLEIMESIEFDSVIEILENGTFIHRHDLYSPNLYNDSIDSDEWEFASDGYTNQYGYNGPMLHNSEHFSSSMVQDMIDNPGIYVLVYGTYDNDDSEFVEVEPTIIEGWAILKRE